MDGLGGADAGGSCIEPASSPGTYDREVFIVMKESASRFSRGEDMAMDALPEVEIPALKHAPLDFALRVRA